MYMFGGEKHLAMTKAYIARHNNTGKLIHKAIQHGACGNHFTIADVDTREDMFEPGSESLRMPEFLAKATTI